MSTQTNDNGQLTKDSDIIGYLKEHEHKDMLRFLTCGSVDDGKSTLIGRMLYDSKMVFEDQLVAAESESRKYGTTGGRIDMEQSVDQFGAFVEIDHPQTAAFFVIFGDGFYIEADSVIFDFKNDERMI